MTMKIALLVLLAVVTVPAIFAADEPFAPLPPVDLSKLNPSDFTDAEIDLPFYLNNFHQVADSVVATGADRGFIGISVWRSPKDNHPYNARIMENILSLAYFYTAKRPWNPYYGSAALRQRLEAALDFWCRLQSPEGKFSEYGSQQWNLPATAFATKFMGQTLTLLKDGPPIDPTLLQRVIEADRKAIRVVLTDPDFYLHGKSYSNQFTNVWAGALEFFNLYPDPELEKLFWPRVQDGMRDFQSPAGFFYEANGPDWGYNSYTHQSNLRSVYHYTRGTDRAGQFIEHERRWFEWLSWNAVPEPDGAGWVLNRAIETRQKKPFLPELTEPMAEQIPIARAFAQTDAERLQEISATRRNLVKNWPKVASLQTGEFWSWSPYTFLHRAQFDCRPTQAQRDEARNLLPYVARTNFTHQLMDSRNPMVYTYVRRPSYYAVFNSGKRLLKQQRYGLGLLWSAETGAVLQSQTGDDDATWGTHSGTNVFEADDLPATFEADGQTVAPAPGSRDLKSGDLVVHYPLGKEGEKTIRFEANSIIVAVHHPGPFTEVLPLLSANPAGIIVEKSQLKLPSGDGTFVISFRTKPEDKVAIQPVSPAVPEAGSSETGSTDGKIAGKQVVVVRISATDELRYEMMFAPAPAPAPQPKPAP
ncbi:MAG TPA: hypothetical protein VK738_04730 [Terriglobales bacterium]|nr:hypothetical protein [Terriglobales bacterium]